MQRRLIQRKGTHRSLEGGALDARCGGALFGMLAACLVSGCSEEQTGRIREVRTLPDLYWERAKECRKKEITGKTEICDLPRDAVSRTNARK